MLPVILLFAKAPVPGRVKTRLQPVLSPKQSAELHSSFVGDVLEWLGGFTLIADIEVHLDEPTGFWSEFPYPRVLQSEGDLGQRMWNAVQRAFNAGRKQVLILGSDAPTLPKEHLKKMLNSPADVCFGPTEDGGYYAIQLRSLPQGLFEGVEWSSCRALEQSIAAARRCGLSVALGPRWFDIDSPADLVKLLSRRAPQRTTKWLIANRFLILPGPDDILRPGKLKKN